LRPSCELSSDIGKESSATGSKIKGSQRADQKVKLHNQFEALEIETVKEEAELENGPQHKNPQESGESPSEQRNIFVPEQQSQKDEFMLGCFCFFQDLQSVRSFLQGIWQKYKEKQTSLVTASVVTASAMDLVRRAEQNFMKMFSQEGDYYDCFVDQMFRQACALQGQPFLTERDYDETGKELREMQPHVDDMVDQAEWIMLSSWHLLRHSTRNWLEDKKNKALYTLAENAITRLWQEYRTEPCYAGRKGQHKFHAELLGLSMVALRNCPQDFGSSLASLCHSKLPGRSSHS
jgi:hypothetical protein